MQTQARRIVTKIDANPILVKQNDENGLLRVAAYCRVSTDSEDQLCQVLMRLIFLLIHPFFPL